MKSWRKKTQSIKDTLGEMTEGVFSEGTKDIELDGRVLQSVAQAWSDIRIEECWYLRDRGTLIVEAGGVRAKVATFDDHEAQQIESMTRLGATRIRLLGVGGKAVLVATSGEWQYWARVANILVEA